jgi:hypothetical protein
MKRRAAHERRSYAMYRASKAVERMIAATSLAEKLKASRWTELWGLLAGIRPTRRG